jgi:DNA repair protein RecN (Recombination protein N)
MLRTLEIRDMLIIDRLEIGFQPGLNVLTGETGAGKSILLDALGFVLGWRGRAELVRSGAEQGEVVAEFELPSGHPAEAVLREAGLPLDDSGTLLLRRVNRSDGRKTAWINDRRASGEALRALSETLVELHGQHDDRGLLNPRGHRDMLDAFGGLADRKAETGTAWADLRKAREALAAVQARLDALRTEEDFLRHAAGELDALDPQPGEDAALDAQRRRMQGAEQIRDDVARALALLGLDGAEGAMSDASRWLQGAAGEAQEALSAPLAALDRALAELGEAHAGVERALQDLQFDPLELERAEERLFEIRGLSRKHDVLPDDLGEFADGLRERLAALDAGDADLAAEQSAGAEAEASYTALAEALSVARQAAARDLDAAVMAELAPLKMERAVFETRVSAGDPGPDGQDSVAFTVATNPGAPAGPLDKIASGGELSRFLLALKVCLAGPGTHRTLIFDEIDRGVGGATADAVGRRLSALAEDGQVLVVTHSPQVAALGAHHWRVQKTMADQTTLSTVVALAETDRVDEIARMLAGDTVTDEARAAASALLAAR